MPRDHARIQVAIWSDPDFRKLTVPAQHLYLTILSQPRLSYCGVVDYLPTRLAQMSAKSTPRSIESAAQVLECNDFVVIDRTTGELLIRTFVRHDGLLSSPNVTKAMAKDYLTVLSDDLKLTIEAELTRAYGEDPEAGGWNALRNSYPALFSMVATKGYRKGSGNG